MSKRIFLLCMAFIYILSLTGCSKIKKLDFDVIYYEAMALGENDDIGQEPILLLNHEAYTAFTDEYFADRSMLPTDAPAEDSAVIVLFIPSETNNVNLYYVKRVVTEENTLTITIKKTKSEALVPRTPGAGSYDWVLFIETENKHIKADMKINVTLI